MLSSGHLCTVFTVKPNVDEVVVIISKLKC